MVLQCIGTIFCIVGAFGVSTNSSILKSMPWVRMHLSACLSYSSTEKAAQILHCVCYCAAHSFPVLFINSLDLTSALRNTVCALAGQLSVYCRGRARVGVDFRTCVPESRSAQGRCVGSHGRREQGAHTCLVYPLICLPGKLGCWTLITIAASRSDLYCSYSSTMIGTTPGMMASMLDQNGTKISRLARSVCVNVRACVSYSV